MLSCCPPGEHLSSQQSLTLWEGGVPFVLPTGSVCRTSHHGSTEGWSPGCTGSGGTARPQAHY